MGASIIFYLLGMATIAAVNGYHDPKKSENIPYTFNMRQSDRFFDELFDKDFFNRSRDPFEEMRRIQKQMFQQLTEPDRFQSSFEKWYKDRFGGGDIGEITQREDNFFVYYDIDLKGEIANDVTAEIKNDHVYVSAQIESKKEGRNTSSKKTYKLARLFPVPFGVDADRFKMENSGNKITLVFPKIKM